MPSEVESDSTEHALSLIAGAVQRELESELRGLLMAARMHGYVITVGPDAKGEMVGKVTKVQQ